MHLSPHYDPWIPHCAMPEQAWVPQDKDHLLMSPWLVGICLPTTVAPRSPKQEFPCLKVTAKINRRIKHVFEPSGFHQMHLLSHLVGLLALPQQWEWCARESTTQRERDPALPGEVLRNWILYYPFLSLWVPQRGSVPSLLLKMGLHVVTYRKIQRLDNGPGL